MAKPVYHGAAWGSRNLVSLLFFDVLCEKLSTADSTCTMETFFLSKLELTHVIASFNNDHPEIALILNIFRICSNN